MWPLTGSRARDADAAKVREHASKSHNAQKERQRPIDPQHQSVAGFPDHVADFGSRNDSDFVDGDLRNFTQSIKGYSPVRFILSAAGSFNRRSGRASAERRRTRERPYRRAPLGKGERDRQAGLSPRHANPPSARDRVPGRADWASDQANRR